MSDINMHWQMFMTNYPITSDVDMSLAVAGSTVADKVTCQIAGLMNAINQVVSQLDIASIENKDARGFINYHAATGLKCAHGVSNHAKKRDQYQYHGSRSQSTLGIATAADQSAYLMMTRAQINAGLFDITANRSTGKHIFDHQQTACT